MVPCQGWWWWSSSDQMTTICPAERDYLGRSRSQVDCGWVIKLYRNQNRMTTNGLYNMIRRSDIFPSSLSDHLLTRVIRAIWLSSDQPYSTWTKRLILVHHVMRCVPLSSVSLTTPPPPVLPPHSVPQAHWVRGGTVILVTFRSVNSVANTW